MKKIIDAEAVKLAGLQIDLLQKVRNGQITLDQLEKFNNFSFADREARFGGNKREENTILRLLSGDENIVIPACDGSETIANAKDVFRRIDSDFKDWGLDRRPGMSRQETAVEVQEVVKDATFTQMFWSFGVNLNKLCFSQHQIMEFCKQHTRWLYIDYRIFFLFKVAGYFFVVRAHVVDDGLNVRVYPFEDEHIWDADDCELVVVPQLGSQEL